MRVVQNNCPQAPWHARLLAFITSYTALVPYLMAVGDRIGMDIVFVLAGVVPRVAAVLSVLVPRLHHDELARTTRYSAER